MKTKLKDMNLVQLRNHALRLGVTEKELWEKVRNGVMAYVSIWKRALIAVKAGGKT